MLSSEATAAYHYNFGLHVNDKSYQMWRYIFFHSSARSSVMLKRDAQASVHAQASRAWLLSVVLERDTPASTRNYDTPAPAKSLCLIYTRWYVLVHITEGELTLWWRFDDELWTRFVYVVLSVFCLSWVIPINNDPVRKHDGSCSETSHAKHVPVRKRCFN